MGLDGNRGGEDGGGKKTGDLRSPLRRLIRERGGGNCGTGSKPSATSGRRSEAWPHNGKRGWLLPGLDREPKDWWTQGVWWLTH